MIRPDAAMWMFELASHGPDPVLTAVRELLVGVRYRIQVLAPDGEDDLLYAPAACGLEEALHALRAGELRSVRIDLDSGPLDWVLAFAPRFAGDAARSWSMVVQQSSGNPLRVFRRVSQRPGLQFAVLTADETIDDLLAQVDAGTFPWDHPDLVLGALYAETGEVTARLGPYLLPPAAVPPTR